MLARAVTFIAVALMVISALFWGVYKPAMFAQTQEKLPFMFPVTEGDIDTLPIFVFSTTRPYNYCIRQIIKLHPKSDVTVVDVDEAAQFVKTHCPNVYATYMKVIAISYKSDIFRYCALYTFGGVYIDDDLWIHKPLTQFNKVPGALLVLQDGAKLTVWHRSDDTYGTVTGLIVARQKHLYHFGCTMQILVARVATQMKHVKTRQPKLAVTGPVLLGECIRPGSDATYIGYFQGDTMIHGLTWDQEKLFTHSKVQRLDTPHYSKLNRFV